MDTLCNIFFWAAIIRRVIIKYECVYIVYILNIKYTFLRNNTQQPTIIILIDIQMTMALRWITRTFFAILKLEKKMMCDHRGGCAQCSSIIASTFTLSTAAAHHYYSRRRRTYKRGAMCWIGLWFCRTLCGYEYVWERLCFVRRKFVDTLKFNMRSSI